MTDRVDFRSDTVTKPSVGMRRAMADAEVGDAVYDEDATTKRLESMAAEMLGKDAALFFPSATQANLAAIMAHCGRGDEFIVGQTAHAYRDEGGGAAVLGSVQPQPLPNEPEGIIDLEAIASAIKPDDFHNPVTRLLTLENTFNGLPLPEAYVQEATELARDRGLATHLDGARIMNAVVSTGRAAAAVAGRFDSATLCLSKGLGAPVGALLAGPAELVGRAKRLRKTLGGGMRQTGVIAAAGIYALENNVERLREDHDRAARLAEIFADYPELGAGEARTNMVFLSPDGVDMEAFSSLLSERGIVTGGAHGKLRWVTHLDIDDEAIERVRRVCKEFFGR
ncbi:low-specificity L-threonine aldolase [Brevibacterium sp. GP-SGM9]|uniref:low-specificity L-threonine aldolase n=1 Tax=unclassified Brevibacterium TaxID=2614124 RepID=UPI001E4E4AEF|nr:MULTISPECIES: low-specificity L-threonine aldolase [unclassified Brevibacterium]MCD1286089.1 low-specificity L-threonine aldolase [Brevibacterium sp. CCUG 69071]MDK8433440.1 low-specificity L-threonine aldolase [Brevibacterium sp. H-BE7]